MGALLSSCRSPGVDEYYDDGTDDDRGEPVDDDRGESAWDCEPTRGTRVHRRGLAVNAAQFGTDSNGSPPEKKPNRKTGS